ncbi:cyclic nucleotide-binding domain-containing protein [candidate division KSB1 bacterium]|nr:cyclic nucleotide-binding domain-containing protein [candidate division KSB1 bacterium]
MELVEALRQSPITSGLEEQELQQLAEICTARRFYKNDMIFDENDRDETIFILAEGRVCIERRRKAKKHITPKQLITVKRGQIFGEMAFLEKRQRSATARAKGNILVIALTAAEFEKLLDRNSHLGYKVMRNLALIISRRLRKMNEQWMNSLADSHSLIEYAYQ